MKQSQAVVQFTKQVLGDQYDPSTPVVEVISKEQRAQVINMLVEGFEAGSIELSKQYESKSKLRAYCAGLVSNWFNKSKELNGNQRFQIKNPGARTNEVIKQALALKTELLKNGASSEKIEQVDAFIKSQQTTRIENPVELTLEELVNLPSNLERVSDL